MKKRLLSMLLTLCLLLSLLPTVAIEARAAGVTSPLNFDSGTDQSGSGYAWDGTAKKLTLTDFTLDASSVTNAVCAVSLPAGSTIDVSGACSIIAGYDSATLQSAGILVGSFSTTFKELTDSGALTIQGTGSLSVTGGSINNSQQNVKLTSIGIGAKALTVSGSVQLTSTGGQISRPENDATQNTFAFSAGVLANAISMTGGAATFTGGEITQVYYTTSAGFYSFVDTDNAAATLSVTGGSLTTTGGYAHGYSANSNESFGTYLNYNYSGSGNSITVTGQSSFTASYNSGSRATVSSSLVAVKLETLTLGDKVVNEGGLTASSAYARTTSTVHIYYNAEVSPTAISLSPASIDAPQGGTAAAPSVVYTPATTTKKGLTWSIDPAVTGISVDASTGVVSAADTVAAGTTATLRATSTDVGAVTATTTVKVYGPAGAPTGLAAVPGDAQVSLSWTAPADNGGRAVTGYTVTYTPAGGAAGTQSAAGTSAVVTGLANGTAYTFTVAALNGLTGTAGTAVTATPKYTNTYLPNTAGIQTPAVADPAHSIQVKYSDATAEFQLVAAGAPPADNGWVQNSDNRSHTFTGLTLYTQYTLYVRYPETATSAASAAVSKVVATAPEPPAADEGYTIDYADETVTANAGYTIIYQTASYTSVTLTEGLEKGPCSFAVQKSASAPYPASAATTVTLSRPDAPAVSDLTMDYTAKTFTLPIGEEYVVSQTNPEAYTTFTASGGVALSFSTRKVAFGGTPFSIYFRTQATASAFRSKNASVAIKTQFYPPTIAVTARTADSLTLAVSETGSYQGEVRVAITDGSNVSADNYPLPHTYTNLKAGTEYTFKAWRTSTATEFGFDSNEAQFTFATAQNAPAAGVGYSIDYATGIITVLSGYEVSNVAAFNGAVYTSGSTVGPGTYYIRFAAAGSVPASEAASFEVLQPGVLPDTVNKVSFAGNSITVTAPKVGMEYCCVPGTVDSSGKISGTPVWTDPWKVTDAGSLTHTFAGLVSEQPYVVCGRVAADPATKSLASGTKTVSAVLPPSASAVTINYETETVTLADCGTTNCRYRLMNGSSEIASGGSLSGVLGSSAGKLSLYIAAGGSNLSPATELTIPARPAAAVLTVNNVAETVTIPAGYVYRIGNGSTVGAAASDTAVTLTAGSSLTCWLPATADSFKSAETVLTAPARGTTPTQKQFTSWENFLTETITFPSNVEYRSTAADAWKTGGETVPLSEFGWTTVRSVNISVRSAADSTHYASAEQSCTVAASGSIVVGEGFSVDLNAETIHILAGYEAATADTFAAGTKLADGAAVGPQQGVYIRTLATKDAPVSYGVLNHLPARLNNAAALAADPASETVTVPAGYVYAVASAGGTASSWTAAGTVPVAPGQTLYWRLPANGTNFASETKSLTVPARRSAPGTAAFTVDYSAETLTAPADFALYEYAVSGGSWVNFGSQTLPLSTFGWSAGGPEVTVDVRLAHTDALYAGETTKLTVTSVAAIASFAFSTPDELPIPTAAAGSTNTTITAAALDAQGNPLDRTVSYALTDENGTPASYPGVSLSGNVLTVGSAASLQTSSAKTVSQTIYIKCSCSSKTGLAAIKLTREAAAVASATVTGSETVAIPGRGEAPNTSGAYTASFADQYGNAMTAEPVWRLAAQNGVPAGVTIENGRVQVSADAADWIINATQYSVYVSAGSTNISCTPAAVTVKRSAPVETSVEIYRDGTFLQSDTLTVPAEAATLRTSYEYTVCDQYGSSMRSAATGVFRLDTTDPAVTLSGSEVIVGSTANVSLSHTLTVTVAGKTAQITLNLVGLDISWPYATEASDFYGHKWSEIVTLEDGSAKLNETDVPGTFSVIDTAELPAVGDRVYQIRFVSLDGKWNVTRECLLSNTTGIGKAMLTLVADDFTAYTGDPLPALTYRVEGLVGSDTLAQPPVVTCSADMNKAGEYEISVSGGRVPANGNYYDAIDYVGGILRVKSRNSGGAGGSTDSGTTVTVPVSSGEGSVKVEATVNNNTAAVVITDKQIEEIASGKTGTGTVKLDVSSLDVRAATVPAKVIAAASGSASAEGVEVALPTGTVTLDKAALAAVSDRGGDVTISVDRVDNAALTETQKEVLGAQAETAVVVDVTVLASGQKVSAFGGGSVGIAVPYTPKAGEDTSKLVVWFVKDDGSIEPKTGFYNARTGKFEFKTEHLSQYVLVSFPFKDVAADSWYYGNAAYAYMNGLFAGTGETTFSPAETMTRGMLVTVLYRMAGSPAVPAGGSFTDVAADAYYAKAVAWASANKLVTGYDAATFAPDDTVTREQLAAILCRYAQLSGFDLSKTAGLGAFSDAAGVSAYAVDAVKWAVGAGLITGSDGRLLPQNGAQRCQVAAILQRFEQKLAK